MMNKAEIRQLMIKKRQALTREEVARRSRALVERITLDPRFIAAKTVAMYQPLGNEVDLRALMKTGKRIAFPKVEGLTMHFYAVTSKTRYVQSQFGILEPVDGVIVDDEIDLLLAPTLALSHNCYRIGFGKGYYDRFLTVHHPKLTIGVIYDFQLVDEFETHAGDVPLDDVYIA